MTVLVAGVIVPVLLHFVSPQAMPWWPDTISLGIAFAVTAAVVAAKSKKDREVNRRLWQSVRALWRETR